MYIRLHFNLAILCIIYMFLKMRAFFYPPFKLDYTYRENVFNTNICSTNYYIL